MKLVPLFDRVIFKNEDTDEISEGGIILPGSSDLDDLQRGKVIAVGPGRIENEKVVPMNIKEGDTIVYNEDDAVVITISGEQFLIIEEFNVMALLK